MLYLLLQNKEDKDLVQDTLALHQEIVDNMNNSYCLAYKQEHQEEPTLKTYEQFGEFFLELKLVAGIEHAINDKKPLIILWTGGRHIERISKTLTEKLGFIQTKKDLLPSKDTDQKLVAILKKSFDDLLATDEGKKKLEKCIEHGILFIPDSPEYDAVPIPNIKEFFDTFMPTINKKQ
jgi:hypothetical protein